MWQVGQQVMSTREPELGLGTITALHNNRTFEVFFPEAKETRIYSFANHPLKVAGEVEQTATQKESSSFAAIKRTDCALYELRKEAWQIKSKSLGSKAFGLIGPRVRPLAHQLYIATEIARRHNPHIILADEVGLGKTIEAGLIFSAMRALDLAKRVLIIVPSSLTNQWLFEMYRRFNETFTFVNQERLAEDEASLGASTFSINQKLLVEHSFLTEDPENLKLICAENWDLVIIDEAHHLKFQEEGPSPLWEKAHAILAQSKASLLLTATPRQRGTITLFGLLHLLDSNRFNSYERFLMESEDAVSVAKIVKSILSLEDSKEKEKQIAAFIKKHPDLFSSSTQTTEKEFLSELIDRHGTGRVLIRNRRQTIKGFPRRNLLSIPLVADKAYFTSLNKVSLDDPSKVLEYAAGRNTDLALIKYKLDWLASYIRETKEKVLILCYSQQATLLVKKCLEGNLDSSKQVLAFHEGLSILERDKAAAQFADNPSVVALVSSEIGGEGRNFQFVRKLVLFDLPIHPDLLEQRIGRLDRIGQGPEIEIIVPWVSDSPEEALFKWYHEGLNAFSSSESGNSLVLEEMSEELFDTLSAFFPCSDEFENRKELLTDFIFIAKQYAQKIRTDLENSTDILLDYNSFHPEVGQALLEEVENFDDDPALEFFIVKFLDNFGVDYDEYDDRGTLVIKSESLNFISENLKDLSPSDDTLITFDRQVALKREDIAFLSFDHPFVENIFDSLVGHEEGALTCGTLVSSELGHDLLISFSFVVESKGPKYLELSRFLPIKHKEVTLSQRLKKFIPGFSEKYAGQITDVSDELFVKNREAIHSLIQSMLEFITPKLFQWKDGLINQSINDITSYYSKEISRLKHLKVLNPSIEEEEILALENKAQESLLCIKEASWRLDAVRITQSKAHK